MSSPASSTASSSAVPASSSVKPVRKVRKWVTRNTGISTNQISPLVRCTGEEEPSPYSVLDGVPFGSAVVSMTPEAYMSFMQDQGWYSADELRDLAAKKLLQYENNAQ